jgi:hypothetical protein
VEAWPAVYLLDADGVIRAKSLCGADLEATVERLVRAAEGRR